MYTFQVKGFILAGKILHPRFLKNIWWAPLSKEHLFQSSASVRSPKIKWTPRALIRSNTVIVYTWYYGQISWLLCWRGTVYYTIEGHHQFCGDSVQKKSIISIAEDVINALNRKFTTVAPNVTWCLTAKFEWLLNQSSTEFREKFHLFMKVFISTSLTVYLSRIVILTIVLGKSKVFICHSGVIYTPYIWRYPFRVQELLPSSSTSDIPHAKKYW